MVEAELAVPLPALMEAMAPIQFLVLSPQQAAEAVDRGLASAAKLVVMVEAEVEEALRTLAHWVPGEAEPQARARTVELNQALDGEVLVEVAQIRSVVLGSPTMPEREEVGCGITYPASILHMQAVVAGVRIQVAQVR